MRDFSTNDHPIISGILRLLVIGTTIAIFMIIFQLVLYKEIFWLKVLMPIIIAPMFPFIIFIVAFIINLIFFIFKSIFQIIHFLFKRTAKTWCLRCFNKCWRNDKTCWWIEKIRRQSWFWYDKQKIHKTTWKSVKTCKLRTNFRWRRNQQRHSFS